jgi:energy-coupling factor transport system ATP-binding protein
MITFSHVTYTYPGASRPALHDISLELPAGEFVLVAGESGAGKSTLLRCLNGLVPHFTGGVISGAIRVHGLDPVAASPQVMSRHVGFVFQDPESQFVMDRVEDEIAFALENAAIPPQEMRVRVEETLDLLDLAPLRDRPLATLSGGEKQRVAIAAALALRPAILVLDEPTSQLDPKSAEDVLNALVRLNQDLGLTVVLAEHRLERVLAYVDRMVYVAAGGTDVLVDEPRAVLEQIGAAPPLVRLAKRMGWSPLPLTIKEGLRFSRAAQPAAQPAGLPAATRAPQPVSTAAPYLSVRDVGFSYRDQPVLKQVALDVRPGEIVALMGRNGAGKTTLLKSLVGLVKPAHGHISVAGQETRGRETADICRDVAYLPQDPNALLFADSVADELAVTLRNHGRDAAQPAAQAQITKTLARLRLSHKAAAYPRDLSVGERQRVALGAVTVTQPGALLLDEPTRGLDYAAKAALMEMIREWSAAGAAVVIVTHDVELAAALAHRVVLMSQGEIIADGLPAQVLGSSPLFAPQVARLFPNSGWLTPEDALMGMGIGH